MRAFSPACKSCQRHRDGETLIGASLLRCAEGDTECAVAGVETQPFHTDRTARHALGARIHGAVELGHHIGARPPILTDLECDASAAFRHRHRLQRQELVADHGHDGLARHARRELHFHVFAGLIGRLVQRDVEHIGRFAGFRNVPAG